MEGDIISQKLDELIALAKAEGDSDLGIVLNTVAGARASGDEGTLAARMQDFTKDVLLPNLRRRKEEGKASMN